jgi:hypothetical protein
MWNNDDLKKYAIAKNLMNDKYAWIEEGISGFIRSEKKSEDVKNEKHETIMV